MPAQALARSKRGDRRPSRGASAGDLKVEWLPSPSGIDTVRPRFSWILHPADARARDVRQTACRVIVATTERAVQRGSGDIWDSGIRQTSAFCLQPPSNLPLRSQTRYWWSVMVWDGAGRPSRRCKPAAFLTGILKAGDWQAQWIAAEPDTPPMPLPPSATIPNEPVAPKPLPVFRRDFPLAKPVAGAVVSISGLGHYALNVNGLPVTSGVLNPGWTNYRKTVFYNTFDVTRLLRRGCNALSVMLGNGMYNAESYPGRYTKFVGSFGQPKLILKLTITHTDDSQTVVVSDTVWRTRPGPVVLSSAYNEDFDAGRIAPDWTVAAPHGDGWQPALEVQGPSGALRAQNIPPVAEAKTYKPVSITQPKPGVFVYDFGQNMSGWPKIAVRGPAGATVKLTPAELLAEDGLVDPYSAGGRPGIEHYYSYTLRGRGKETWHPQFSYYGFRYLQVEGAAPAKAAGPGTPVLLSLEAAFLHDDLAPTGQFETTDTLFDRIHRLIKFALLSNSFSVLSDCPHREKLGWLEQTYLNADTVFCNEDAVTLYEKMANDICDSQTADGMVPGIAPEYVAFLNKDGSSAIWRDSPEWGAAVVLSPLAAYRYYGDRHVLEIAYPAMKRYAGYLEKRLKGGLIGFGMGDWYDIGPAQPGPTQLTSLTLTSTATYYAIVSGIAEVARLLERESDAGPYAGRAAEVKRVFNDKLFNPATGGYDSNSQTANAMPLALGLVPPERRQQALANLVDDIRARNNHVTAGDIGFHYVVMALMENGRADVLYDILSRTDAPSYGYQLAQGATALTEAWNANRHNSQNHFMLGHAETWFYRGLGGIDVDMCRQGADRIRVAPQTVAGISGVCVRYRSVLGEIVSLWRRKNGMLELFAGIPAGAQAKIVLPSVTEVREHGVPLASAKGVRSVETQADKRIVTVGSGDYRFVLPES